MELYNVMSYKNVNLGVDLKPEVYMAKLFLGYLSSEINENLDSCLVTVERERLV